MATLFFGVKGATIDLQQDLQIADADAPRIIGYLMQSEHGTVTENVISETPDASWSPNEKEGETEEGRPTIKMQAWVTRRATPEETAANYARSILKTLLVQTVAHEKAEASRVATDAVTEIKPID
jgi:hypothetical protein